MGDLSGHRHQAATCERREYVVPVGHGPQVRTMTSVTLEWCACGAARAVSDAVVGEWTYSVSTAWSMP